MERTRIYVLRYEASGLKKYYHINIYGCSLVRITPIWGLSPVMNYQVHAEPKTALISFQFCSLFSDV